MIRSTLVALALATLCTACMEEPDVGALLAGVCVPMDSDPDH